MTLEQILNIDSSRAVADKAVELIEQKPILLAKALQIALNADYPIAMRSAHVVQLYCENHHDALMGKLDEIIEKISISKIDGVKRCMLKVIAEFVGIKRLPDIGPLVNQCFIWLNDPKETVAVKIYCMDLLYQACLIEPDLKHELVLSIQSQFDVGTVGFQSRARKVLKLLRCY